MQPQNITSIVLCACGCGQTRPSTDKHGHPRQYLHGHGVHARGPRSKRSLAERFWQYVNKTDSCWLWTGATSRGGYGVINAGGNSDKILRAPRVSWALHNGPIPDGLSICHRCDNPPCVNPLHLFVGTIRDNNVDMWRKGRQSPPPQLIGSQNPQAKLTAQQVQEIRARYKRGTRQVACVREYGIAQSLIWRIVHGRTWQYSAAVRPTCVIIVTAPPTLLSGHCVQDEYASGGLCFDRYCQTAPQSLPAGSPHLSLPRPCSGGNIASDNGRPPPPIRRSVLFHNYRANRAVQ